MKERKGEGSWRWRRRQEKSGANVGDRRGESKGWLSTRENRYDVPQYGVVSCELAPRQWKTSELEDNLTQSTVICYRDWCVLSKRFEIRHFHSPKFSYVSILMNRINTSLSYHWMWYQVKLRYFTYLLEKLFDLCKREKYFCRVCGCNSDNLWGCRNFRVMSRPMQYVTCRYVSLVQPRYLDLRHLSLDFVEGKCTTLPRYWKYRVIFVSG